MSNSVLVQEREDMKMGRKESHGHLAVDDDVTGTCRNPRIKLSDHQQVAIEIEVASAHLPCGL